MGGEGEDPNDILHIQEINTWFGKKTINNLDGLIANPFHNITYGCLIGLEGRNEIILTGGKV